MRTSTDWGWCRDEEREPSDEFARNLVIRTDPGAGSDVSEGDTITVVISAGADTVAVPNLIGQTRGEASSTLNAAGLQLGSVTEEPAAQAAGTVIRSDPGAGTDVERNSQVNLVLSTGPTPSPTPQPTPPPTPPPTPAPTATPSPAPRKRCDIHVARRVLASPAVDKPLTDPGGHATPMTAPMTVDQSTFEAQVLNSDKPVLVDFWAPWCGPCRLVSPVVESMGEAHGDKIATAKINTDDNQELAMRYSIFSIPTMILFKDGREAARMVGYMPQETMEERLRDHLA